MNIILVYSPAGNDAVPNSMTWYKNLCEPLIDLGHNVIQVRLDIIEKSFNLKKSSPQFRTKFSEYLLDLVKKENQNQNIDLFFSYLMDVNIYPKVVSEIKKIGIPTANFSCNNIHQFYLTEEIAPFFDFNLHAEKEAKSMFQNIGANPIWFPMAANPKYYKQINTSFKYDVSFIGSEYAKRSNYIGNLLKNGVDVDVFGPGWKKKKTIKNIYKASKMLFSSNSEKQASYSAELNQHFYVANLIRKYSSNFNLPVSDLEMISIFNQSKISLGFLEVFLNHDSSSLPLVHIHLREFEAPMCGALYMTTYCDELTEFYEPDKEIVLYRNNQELLDKVQFYLKNEKAASKIRELGYKRAQSEHTCQKRLKEVLEKII